MPFCSSSTRLIIEHNRPENVLFGAYDNVLVADFGLSLDDGGLAQVCHGSRRYMAPEVVQHQPYDGRADVWSAGVLLHEMINGWRSPGVRAEDALQSTGSWMPPARPHSADPVLWALLQRMMIVDPTARPDTLSLLQTPEASAVSALAAGVALGSSGALYEAEVTMAAPSAFPYVAAIDVGTWSSAVAVCPARLAYGDGGYLSVT